MPKSLPDALDLPIPKLVEADEDGEVKDPRVLLNGGTVRVCYDDMQPTDRITLNWPLAGSSYPPIEPQDGGGDGCINFYIPAQYIALRLDNFARFTYTVTRDGEEDQTSLEGEVRISLPYLPQVQVLKTINDELDLSLFCCKDPVICIPAWDFASTIQTINCYISGIRPNGTKFGFYQYQHEPVTEEDVRDGWKRVLPQSVLRQFKHDSELYIFCTVRFSAVTPYRGFPGKAYTLLTEPHLELDAPNVVQSVECSPGEFLLNPLNATEGATLRVAYDHPCPKDYVCAHWTGTAGPGTPYLACQEVGADGVVDFAVPASAISANFKETVSVYYTVLRNGETWTSRLRDIHILNISDLPKPSVTEATGTTLDLNTFPGDAQITVIPWWFIDKVHPRWLWVTGTLEDGTSYSFEVLRGESGPLTGVIETLPRRELQKLADCSCVQVHFAVNFNGQLDKASAEEFPALELKLVQEDLVLKAPTVREAVGSELTIWNGRDGVTVRVEYERISAQHEISLCWKDPDGARLPLAPKPGNSSTGYVDFDIPREAVIRGAGKRVVIHYTVTSACKNATSDDLELNISVPVRLPTPVVPEATRGILDLRTVLGDAHITVNDEKFDKAWWFILAGQMGWLECRGIKEDGSPYTIKVMVNEPITENDVADGLSRVLRRQELDKLRNGTALDVVFKGTTEIGGNVGSAIEFPLLHLAFRKLFRDETDFNPQGPDNGWNHWKKGAGATDSRDLVVKPGAGPGGQAGYYLFDWGYTNTRDPITQREKLFKEYFELEEGNRYTFSAWVRDNSGAHPAPRLVLVADGVEITPITTLGRNWDVLEGVFTATSAATRLSIDNLQMGMNGNDFDVTSIVVTEV